MTGARLPVHGEGYREADMETIGDLISFLTENSEKDESREAMA